MGVWIIVYIPPNCDVPAFKAPASSPPGYIKNSVAALNTTGGCIVHITHSTTPIIPIQMCFVGTPEETARFIDATVTIAQQIETTLPHVLAASTTSVG